MAERERAFEEIGLSNMGGEAEFTAEDMRKRYCGDGETNGFSPARFEGEKHQHHFIQVKAV